MSPSVKKISVYIRQIEKSLDQAEKFCQKIDHEPLPDLYINVPPNTYKFLQILRCYMRDLKRDLRHLR